MNDEITLIDVAEEPASRAVATTGAPVQGPMAGALAFLANGGNPEQLERMLALQERWEASEAAKAYNAAFAAFKAEAVVLVRNKQVTDGPLKGKSYAELYSVVQAVTPALSRHGLSASWSLTRDEKDWMEVTCTLKHVAGHSESVSMGGPPDTGGAKNPIQARASAKSYLERYTLKAICGLAEGGDDTDGSGGGVPEELLTPAREKAMEGEKALKAYWQSLSVDARKVLQPELNSLKQAAQAADKERANAPA